MRTLLLLAALLVSACGGSAPPSPEITGTPTAPPVVLEGSSWRATLVDGEAPAPGHEVTLELRDGQVGGNTGCNSYGGDARLDDGRLVIGEVRMTLAACAEELPSRIEGAFLQILQEQPVIVTDGSRLLLRGTTGEIVMEPGPPAR